MGKIIPTIIFLILINANSFAQLMRSAHFNDYNKYKNKDVELAVRKSVSKEIIPLNKSVQKELSKSVFGFYPDWEFLDNAHNNFNYDLLTHIAAFDFHVSSTGKITNPVEWPWTDVINKAHENGVKMIMVVVNFDADEINAIMTNSFTRWTFMIGVKNKITKYNLDGVNIDFEGLNVADRGSLINEFMQELSDTVHSLNPELEVSFDAPAVNWGGWNLTGLAASCDYLVIMGYDFYGSWSSTTGPSAPLNSTTLYNIKNTIDVEYGTVSLFYPEKLILGVPYYGPHWIAKSNNERAEIISYVQAEVYRNAQAQSENYGLNWSTTFKNSWYSYSVGNDYHQVWFDNDSSLGLKYDLAIAKNLKGIGMWALGYDGSRTELWDLIENKFSTPVSVTNSEEIPVEFSLLQNYPNPFNPATTIKYTIPKEIKHASTVQLSVYDVLGREMVILVNEQKAPGTYEAVFDATALASGTYFYTLQYGEYLKTKKMIILK